MFDTLLVSAVAYWPKGKSILGGCLDLKIDLSRTGLVVNGIPLAVSAHDLINSIADIPSAMQWLIDIPKAKPPHLNLVTCKGKLGKYLTSTLIQTDKT